VARRFRFRLEPVLRQRERVEEARLRDFAEAQRGVVAAEEYLHRLADEKSQEQQEIVRLYEARAPFEEVLRVHQYLNTVNLRAGFGQRALAQHAAVAAQRRGFLLEARQRRRALELLKERQRAAHRAEQERAERRELDSLAIQRHRVSGVEET